MKKYILLFMLCLGCLLQANAQKVFTSLNGEFDSDGAYDKWTAWKQGEFPNGTKIECRAMLSASKKGCKITVETKNVSADKIKVLVVFTYNIPNVTTEMTGFEKESIAAGATVSTSYTASYCGGKGNDYAACYSCGHVFKIFLK
ncbi:hypothetical protein [Ferruginibacter profundus]